eukprot:15130524-Alexandrium_andersonii.AAC.1
MGCVVVAFVLASPLLPLVLIISCPQFVHLQHSPPFQAADLESVREVVQRTGQGIADPWAQVPVIHEVLLDGVLLVHQLASVRGQ